MFAQIGVPVCLLRAFGARLERIGVARTVTMAGPCCLHLVAAAMTWTGNWSPDPVAATGEIWKFARRGLKLGVPANRRHQNAFRQQGDPMSPLAPMRELDEMSKRAVHRPVVEVRASAR